MPLTSRRQGAVDPVTSQWREPRLTERVAGLRRLVAILVLLVQMLGISIAPTFMGLGLAHALGNEPGLFICGPGTSLDREGGDPAHDPGGMQRLCPLCQPASSATAPVPPTFSLGAPIDWAAPIVAAPRVPVWAPSLRRTTAPPPPSHAPPSA